MLDNKNKLITSNTIDFLYTDIESLVLQSHIQWLKKCALGDILSSADFFLFPDFKP